MTGIMNLRRGIIQPKGEPPFVPGLPYNSNFVGQTDHWVPGTAPGARIESVTSRLLVAADGLGLMASRELGNITSGTQLDFSITGVDLSLSTIRVALFVDEVMQPGSQFLTAGDDGVPVNSTSFITNTGALSIRLHCTIYSIIASGEFYGISVAVHVP